MGKVGGTSEHDAMIARGNAVIAAEKAKLLTWEQSVELNKRQAAEIERLHKQQKPDNWR